MAKFIVCVNAPGTPPESEPGEFDTLKIALDSASEDIDVYIEDGWEWEQWVDYPLADDALLVGEFPDGLPDGLQIQLGQLTSPWSATPNVVVSVMHFE